MAENLQEHVKYTAELEKYVKTKGSCVNKVNTNFHMSLQPHCLGNFKEVLMNEITKKKVGVYDVQNDCVVLNVKNIKVLSSFGAMRFDDSRIHFNCNANYYVFRPEIGAILSGVVKYIDKNYIGVTLYRVFRANIRFGKKVKESIQIDGEVKFRVKSFNIKSIYPYINGELVTTDSENDFKHEINNSIIKKEGKNTIKTETTDANEDLEELLSLVKQESEDDQKNLNHISNLENNQQDHKKSKKRKRKISDPTEVPEVKIKVKKENAKLKKVKLNGTSDHISIKVEDQA